MDSREGFKRECIVAEGGAPLSDVYGFTCKATIDEFSAPAEIADSEDCFDVELHNNRIVRRMLLN
ncbi:hypothetical protein [Alteromonas sp. ASW11-130]|uniref:hypothetical protein n=1 Tax=Alteromonas sp. ASW11-130 TaxID=3015775 RepID=UPI0022426104|nr:hypothetical protein [Alteromonas sp. ASW11-130]MCW8090900.1 hypothetical protein [Alteromonas sp. ASW11-130]